MEDRIKVTQIVISNQPNVQFLTMSHSIVCHNSLAKLVFPLLLILAGIINTSQASEGFDNSTALLFKGYAVFHAEKQTPNGLISQKFCVVDIIWNIEPLVSIFTLIFFLFC